MWNNNNFLKCDATLSLLASYFWAIRVHSSFASVVEHQHFPIYPSSHSKPLAAQLTELIEAIVGSTYWILWWHAATYLL